MSSYAGSSGSAPLMASQQQNRAQAPPAAEAAELISFRTCNLGFVTMAKWVSGYLTVVDGVARLYADKESCDMDENNSILELVLQPGWRASEIKKKDYSKNPLQIVHFYSFYIEVDQGLFASLRKIKIGCTDQATAKRLAKCINYNANS